ncbi:ADAMTS-like protein 3 isoform X3 [Denticeps clupeoides]|nr:ADAMTS-like protein 3 isoform X3 [Denticeps clupeoides]
MTRSDADRDVGWDAWGSWSECSRTCGGGASYSLRRCLNGGNCKGRNIRYRTCSNTDCPLESGDFRTQQCSAHNDIKYQGQTYEWIPVTNDPVAPCALKCHARGKNLVVELAPKVLDGTRCRTDSLDMCINGICQEVGCDRQLGSNAREDNCGVCTGNGSTCRLVRGQTLSHVSPDEPLKTMIEVPLGSRHLRVTAKGPDVIIIETHAPHGTGEELILGSPGSYIIGNTSVDFQRVSDSQTLRSRGPLAADLIIKVKYSAPRDTVLQFLFYQPIRYQWRETDFFPCSVTCGGGYQLNSAECVDIRHNTILPEQHCQSYPENTKPKPKLKECNMDPCPESDGFKEVMPYDHFQPLPRWEQNPWTSCSVSCGGGSQERSVVCVEEDVHSQIAQVEEWKCMHSPRPEVKQDCNTFECPQWSAMEWSQCTVTCGRGLRYRVVLCIDHRGQHTGGCNARLKPHIKEDCLVPIACHKPRESLPVEAKQPWLKQANELQEPRATSEEPSFVVGPWSQCSATCGSGLMTRLVKCRVLLSFTQTEVDLPDEECRGEKPPQQRPCMTAHCVDTVSSKPCCQWTHKVTKPCSASCGEGTESLTLLCQDAFGRVVDDALCDVSRRPYNLTRVCSTQPCPLGTWEVSRWSRCSATCGVGLQIRSVYCVEKVQFGHERRPDGNCRGSKPSEVQPCNQIDCLPSWEVEDWQQCSHTCGGGTQSRKVYCKQRLKNGSFRKLKDGTCRGVKPMPHRACATNNCLMPRLEGGEWSECSVTCGTGVQRREPVCRKVTPSGQEVTLSATECSGITPPSLIKSCRRGPCKKKEYVVTKSCASILTDPRTFIQTRPKKRLHFKVGGRAYLQPKTSVLIKCPVEEVFRSTVRWKKDGEYIQTSKHMKITKSGALRISNLKASDIGHYRCMATMVSASFVLKLIGEDNKLIERPDGKQVTEDYTADEDLVMYWWSPRCLNKQYLMPGWKDKSEFYEAECQASPNSDNSHLGSRRPGYSLQLPDRHMEASMAYDVFNVRFEELQGNISGHGSNGQTVFRLKEKVPGPQTTTEEVREVGEVGHSEDSPPNLHEHIPEKDQRAHRKPVISRRKQYDPVMNFHRDVKINIGRTAYLTNATRSLFLLCPVHGVPPPTVSWTKDGSPLQYKERILWPDTGGLHIYKPGPGDVGLYRCTASNELGSDVESSDVLLAEYPKISLSWRNVSDLTSATLKTVVGGWINASLGTNITLDCPVTGVPQPIVSWHKKEGPLNSNARQWLNGSLLLQNISLQNYGTYSCMAANPIGKSVASTHLLVSGLNQAPPEVSRNGSYKRVLMASRIHTSVTVRTGEILRIGCPVVPNHRKAIKWYFQNQTVEEAQGLLHRLLVGGRVLEVNTHRGKFAGQYRCQTRSDGQLHSAWIQVNLEEFRWRMAEWTTCTARCGNRGTQTMKLRCISPDGVEVPPSTCQHLPRPVTSPRACNFHDCPASWVTTVWSKCSTSCGLGFRQRQVSCQQIEAAGTARLLPPSACRSSTRPVIREECSSGACAEWITRPWGQCTGRCLGPGVATQSRTVMCKHLNISSTSRTMCISKERPLSVRNCSSETCDVRWRVWPWRPCTVACGSGFQSRRVECVNQKNNKTLSDVHCAWQRRPITWQHCSVTSCGSACKDTSGYCAVVKRLQLCLVDLYRQRCCESCTANSRPI